MSREPVLEVADAVVERDGVRVLDGLTLTVHAGEHTAVIGPNGAGKSALINLLTHHYRALAREHGPPPVRVLGSDNWNVFELRSRLGIVSTELHHRFVSGNSAGPITGEEAVLSAFFASHGIFQRRLVTDDMRHRAGETLARMGVAHLAPKMLHQMSSGEARRVLLARALVSAPEVLVLDEPTAGLDVISRHRFMERVRLLTAGTTLILVTHHTEEIVPEISQVVLVRHGRVAYAGPKRDVLTSAHLSEVFEAPISLTEADGYYYARP